MRNFIKRKTSPSARQRAPIAFINSASSSSQLPKPNQNVNPEKTATVLMANSNAATGGGTAGASSHGGANDEDDPPVAEHLLNLDEEDGGNIDLSERVKRLTMQIREMDRRAPSVTIQSPVKVRKFSGQDSEDVREWIQDFQNAAIINKWTPAQTYVHLKAHVDGRALSWLRAYTYSRHFNTSEAHLKLLFEAFIEHFTDARPMLKNLSQIRQLRQKEDEPVQDYYFAMIHLLGKAGVPMRSTQAVDYVISGLKPSLAQKVYADADRYLDVEQLFAKLKVLDEAENHRKTREEDSAFLAGQGQSSVGPDRRVRFSDLPAQALNRQNDEQRDEPRNVTATQPQRQFYQRPRGRYDGRPGSFRNQSRQFNGQRPRDRNESSTPEVRPPQQNGCWNCGDGGHWSFECPHNQIASGRQGNEQRGPSNRWTGPSSFRGRTRWSAPQQGRRSYTSN